jgi:hypothetical protein
MKPLPQKLVADCLQLIKPSFQRGFNDADNFKIHVSDVINSSDNYKFCARNTFLGNKFRSKSVVKSVNLATAIVLDLGEWLHNYVRDNFINNSDYKDYVWGDWVCQDCGDVKKECHTTQYNALCDKCGSSKPRTYKEIDLFVNALRLSGHPDFLIKYEGVLYLYEIKTLNKASLPWEELLNPIPEHKLQATIYWHMLKIAGFTVSDKIRFVYLNRDINRNMFTRVELIKEFEVEPTDWSLAKIAFARAKQAVTAIKTDIIPPKICSSSSCARALNCNNTTKCFSYD